MSSKYVTVKGDIMPAFYTHARFGKRVLEQLPTEVKEAVDKYPELFFIGLQGPDILFYYRGYKSNHVTKTGYGQHDKPGKEFFEPAVEAARKSKNVEASFSYLAGFICHFTLDSQCHPYIATVEEDTKLSHAEIECEEDRYLMIKDDMDYLRHIEAEKVVSTLENGEIIAQFFQGITGEEVKTALWYTKVISRLFCAPGKIKRKFVLSALKAVGQPSLSGMIVNYEENPSCRESNLQIEAFATEVVPLACELISEMKELVENSEKEIVLHPRYEKTFGE